MTLQRITKRAVDALQSNSSEFTLWDDTVSGFGVRVRPTGAESFVVILRAGAGRGAPHGATRSQRSARSHQNALGTRSAPCPLYPRKRTCAVD